ncbi:MAG: hypothetical protein ACT4R6_11580 [Gemmatimonadaceae bacterium]
MSPRERADRLFDRVMRLETEGKNDSARFFAGMAINAYESMQPLDAHLRYDLGRVAAAVANLDLAQAQADSILATRPGHLLGLILAARVAQQRGDPRAARALWSRLLSAEASERSAALEEYRLHDADIAAAVRAAREQR